MLVSNNTSLYNKSEFIVPMYNCFNLKDIFECCQCFRWNKLSENRYIGVVNQTVIIAETLDNVHFKFVGIGGDRSFPTLCSHYFDLGTDYNVIKQSLAALKDDNLNKGMSYGSGIRILNQNIWEVIISFIISANNNIPRIKNIIDKLCYSYGTFICNFEGKDYYTFPTPEQLSKASVSDLRVLGLGFRDKRVYETTKMIYNNEVDINSLENSTDINHIRNVLLTLPGVGPKVADCILLFGFHRFSVFPVDVCVRRLINNLYKPDEVLNEKNVKQFGESYFGNLAGIAQQYLFNWQRNISK